MAHNAVRLVITGRVQGVGFRAWTCGEARRRGLRGWVRNRHDGSVEALLIGAPEAVEAMLRLVGFKHVERIWPSRGRLWLWRILSLFGSKAIKRELNTS